MGDLMSNILSVHIFTVSYSADVVVKVVYKSGYNRTYEDFDKIPASVRDFVSPEHYSSTRYTFSEDDFYSCASHFHSDLPNLVGSFPRLDVACIDTLLLTDGPESEPEEVEPEEVEPEYEHLEGVCPYPTCSIYGGCPVSCKYSLGFSDQCALDLMSLQVPEFDLEIYVSGAYDCTLEQSAWVCVGVHGCPTEFHDLEAYMDNDGYMRIIVDDVYKRFPFLNTCPLPVLRDYHMYKDSEGQHVSELWKIPLPSHYSYSSIHRVWRGCGSL